MKALFESDAPGNAAEVLAAMAPDLKPKDLARALRLVSTLDDDRFTSLLPAFVEPLTATATAPEYAEWLRLIASRGRPTLLLGLACLLPWGLQTCGANWNDVVAKTVDEVARCWP